ncbi:MAG: S4 domain-containing protein [Bacteroidota bacterium]
MRKSHRFLQLSKARNAGPLPRVPSEWEAGKPMRLNKYLAHAGLANRRSCEHLIKGGQIEVNGEQVRNPGFLVGQNDIITRWKKPLPGKPGLAYALANRAAGIEENSLGSLLRHFELPQVEWSSIFERPKWISGLSLLTNDQAMIERLKSKAQQYKATLLMSGKEEAQQMTMDELAGLDPNEQVGQTGDLIKLMSFDKKDLPRGFYRFLRPEEIGWLKSS